MRLLAALGRAFTALLAKLGFGAAEADVSLGNLSQLQRKITVPAVAGFVMRAHIDRFMLSRRLASVAKLNVPLGRKPRTNVHHHAGSPPVPIARIGAKRMRRNGNQGPRVLLPSAPLSPAGATIIPFPSKDRRSTQRRDHLGKAA